jgi:hypothetical protein
MKYSRIGVATLLFLAIFGCSSKRFDPNQYTEVMSSISNTRDNFTKINTMTGPTIHRGATEYFIRSFTIDGASVRAFQIYAEISSNSVPDHFDRAYDISGKRLSVKHITTELNGCSRHGCSYTQHIGVAIDREYLITNRQTGVRLQLGSISEKELIIIPAAYVQAFIDATK